MGRVFVAGSINMDVVATAERHPKVGETVAGKAGALLSRRQGREPGRGRRQARRADHADRAAWQGCVRRGVEDVPRRAGRRSRPSCRDADAHTGTAIITVANADNTIVVIPGANALVDADDVAAPLRLQRATSRSASSKFRCPPSPLSSSAPAPPAQPRSSIPAPAQTMSRRAARRSSTSSCSTRPSLASSQAPSCRDSDDAATFIDGGATTCRRARTRPSASRSAGAACWRSSAREEHRRSRPRGEGGRHHRRRRLFCRRAGRAAGRRQIHSRRARLRQRRRLDLRAADGRGAVDADGGGSSGRYLQVPAKPGPITPGRVCGRCLPPRPC